MSIEWNTDNIIWKWLDDKIQWDLKVPQDSQVITEVNVLFGKKVTEVTRWEENEWEAFTQDGENINKEDMRVIPIATLLGIDESLKPILKLEIEEGLWRSEDELIWNTWE